MHTSAFRWHTVVGALDQVRTGTLVILTESSVFSTVLPGKCRIVPQLYHDHFLVNAFQFIIRSCIVSIVAASLNNQQEKEGRWRSRALFPNISRTICRAANITCTNTRLSHCRFTMPYTVKLYNK
jgi:hypothetical protein